MTADFTYRTNVPWSRDMSSRRVMYVHAMAQLLCQCTYLGDVEMSTIATVIVNLLTEIEMVETSGTIFSLLVYMYFCGAAM